jgi:hypothetical protein
MDTMTMVGDDAQNETPVDEQYGEEVLSAGWIPLFSILGENTAPRLDGHVDLFRDLMRVDLDAFLKKVYELQR